MKGDGRVLTVLYGTSLGTCRDIAGQIADRAGASGFQVTNAALDDYADGLPETGTLVVVTSTYNGGAPDSATKMETAIREKRIGEVERPELTYAVLGVGNTQWKTYQAFPKLVESTLRQTGAKNLLAARRGRWQRRFRRGRRSAGWARYGSRWARATHRLQRHRA